LNFSSNLYKIPIALTEFPSIFSLGEKLATQPKPGKIDINPPETPLLVGIPMFFVNLPAPLYIPEVVMIVTQALMVRGESILYPVCGLIPPLARHAPKFERDSTFTNKEQS